MSPHLQISDFVLKRLERFDENERTGCIYGLMYNGTLLVIGLSLELFEDKHSYSQLLLNLPTEIELCGVIKFSNTLMIDNKSKQILQEVDITDNPVIIVVNEIKEIRTYFLVHDQFEETDYIVFESSDLCKQFLYIRLNTTVPFNCEATVAGVQNILQSKRKKIASGQVSFNIDNTSVYLFGVASDVGLTGVNTDTTIGELVDSLSNEQLKKNVVLKKWDILPVSLILKATKDIVTEKCVKTAVKMTMQRKPAFHINMPLKIDTLALVHRNTKLLEIYSIMVEAACRSLRLTESVLIEQLGQEGIGDGAGLRFPETLHFLPQELGHFITRIIPKEIPDESIENERQLLHDVLALGLQKPIFCRGNAYFETTGEYLVNPHEGIPINNKTGVTVALVRGRYTYHHYMQNKTNDDGWGCAYRSLQTIVSWFRLQGYTTVEIPTHKEIQECLVKIGDKHKSFVGSKQWIGSTEVMFCLETLLGVQSRILFANSGQELPSYSHDLMNHFQKHGSPIMIGGGVLAHTILGIEYNTNTSETRYLILDPHYTGSEDLNTVLSKGWCGWKKVDFWNKTAHYNMCLPQTKRVF